MNKFQRKTFFRFNNFASKMSEILRTLKKQKHFWNEKVNSSFLFLLRKEGVFSLDTRTCKRPNKLCKENHKLHHHQEKNNCRPLRCVKRIPLNIVLLNYQETHSL